MWASYTPGFLYLQKYQKLTDKFNSNLKNVHMTNLLQLRKVAWFIVNHTSNKAKHFEKFKSVQKVGWSTNKQIAKP